MPAQWYYDKNGQQFGPCPHSQLQGLIQSGQLRGENLVWCQGMADWLPLRSVPALAQLLPAGSSAHAAVRPRRSAAPRDDEYDDEEPRPRRAQRRDDDDDEEESDDEEDRPRRRGQKGRRSKHDIGLTSNEWLIFSILFVLIPAANVVVSSILYYVWKNDKPKKAGQINMLGFIIFGFHVAVGLLVRYVLLPLLIR